MFRSGRPHLKNRRNSDRTPLTLHGDMSRERRSRKILAHTGKESFLTNPVGRTTGTMEEPPKGISSGYIRNRQRKLASWDDGVLVSTRRSNHLSSAQIAHIATTPARMSKSGSAMVTRTATSRSNDPGTGAPKSKLGLATSSAASMTQRTT